MTTRHQLLTIFRELHAMHASRGWHWTPDSDPFEVALGAILVQNTSWTNAERAIANVAAANCLDPAALGARSIDELETLLRPSGQYRQKARKVRAFLDLIEAHGSLEALLSLPASELRARLLATWGIGPETADCIVLYSARQPAFVIDAYTIRIFDRLGVGPGGASYSEWQRFFVDALPHELELWQNYHSLIVLHAKHLCRKNAPHCASCSLLPRCRYASEINMAVQSRA